MKKLPLPSPRSPHNLDRAILDYAQQNVPDDKKSYAKPLWISGLATASVIGIAVLISQPKYAGITEQTGTAAFSTEIREPIRDQAAPTPNSSALVKPQLLGLERASTKRQSVYRLEQMSDDKTSDVSSKVAPNIENAKKQLEKLSVLVEQGSTSQAEAAYDALKDQCYSCDLPDTLTDALEKYLDTTAPPTP